MIKITINQIRIFEHDLQVSGIKNKQTNKKPKKKKTQMITVCRKFWEWVP